jgi:periplasmic divalent cation tolerance protein
MSYSIILTTCPNSENAKNLAKSIISKKMASCIQIKQIESIYEWENKICEDMEYQLIIKTKKSLYSEVENYIKQNHPYSVPQIVEIDISRGSKDYLDWIDSVL